jgi:HPt (histidine-containing phosphotransfer) domain-containing protein
MKTPQETVPTFDPHALAEIRDCDPSGASDLVVELIDLFLEDTPARIAALRMGFDAGDPGAIAREAHALKASTAQLGAMGMSELCRRLEATGREGSLIGIGPLLDTLDEQYVLVQAALHAERGGD